MAETKAKLSNYRQSPRKVRLIADLVRGKNVHMALATLSHMPKRAAEPMAKLIRSALANLPGGSQALASDYIISRIEVGQGIVFKRFMPRARGKASPIRKKTSHISLVLSERSEKSAQGRSASGGK